MTRTELIKVAKEALRKEFKLPLVGTSVETAITDRACDLAFPHFSDEVLEIITSASDGLDPEELGVLQGTVVTYLNRQIDIPYLPESAEKLLFDRAVDAIFSWLKEGKSI
jgi:hypothetical protein